MNEAMQLPADQKKLGGKGKSFGGKEAPVETSHRIGWKRKDGKGHSLLGEYIRRISGWILTFSLSRNGRWVGWTIWPLAAAARAPRVN